MKILTLDTSYTISGFCVYDTEICKIDYGCFVTKKTENKALDYYSRMKFQIKEIIELINQERPSIIIMEAPSFFSKGNTFLQTVASNLIFQFFIIKEIEEKEMTDVEFYTIPPRSLKKMFGSGKLEKKEIIEKIKQLGLINFNSLKSDEIDDVADSIMYLIAFLKSEKKELTKKSNVILYKKENFGSKDFYKKKIC